MPINLCLISFSPAYAKVDVDCSRELSAVQIHVERVIGVLKQKYTILQNTIPISLIPDNHDNKSTTDKIVVLLLICVLQWCHKSNCIIYILIFI